LPSGGIAARSGWHLEHRPRIYDRTGSLLVATLMHASLTASTLILQPLDVTGMRVVTYDLILTAALWLLSVALATANGWQLSRQLLRPRVA
jgi:uncharacterized protein